MRFSYRYGIGSTYKAKPTSREAKIVLGVFLAIGLVFLLIAVGSAIFQTAKEKEYLPAEAEIIELDRKGTPTVEYKAKGKTLTKQLNISSNLFSVGDTISIAYDAKHPHRIIQTGFLGWLFPILFGGIGLSFALIGGILLLRIRRREKRDQEDNPVPWEN